MFLVVGLAAWPVVVVADLARPGALFQQDNAERSREAESPTADGADNPVDATEQGRTTQLLGGWKLVLGKEVSYAFAIGSSIEASGL